MTTTLKTRTHTAERSELESLEALLQGAPTRTDLKEHAFRLRRRCGSYLSEVLEADPSLAARVEDARAALRSVIDRLELLATPRGARVRAQAQQGILRAVRSLRRREERLLLDAYFLDLGGEGG